MTEKSFNFNIFLITGKEKYFILVNYQIVS